ncbi:MAG: hypothetical protein K2L57_00275 [Muribaculaceae bacterium]|nr:hypothetical protein [Muribaculaceae bacterium]
MRHLYIALTSAVISIFCASAQTNLLDGAVTSDTDRHNSPYFFYESWLCHYADGTVPQDGVRPNSVFSEVLPSWTVMHDGKKYDIGGSDANGFQVGLPVAVLDYPTYNEAHPFRDFSYSFPIEVPRSGRYILSGCARSLTSDRLTSTPPSTVNTYQIMVFVADPGPGEKSIEVVDKGDKAELEVRDSDGTLLPSGFTPLPAHSLSSDTGPFEIGLDLDTDAHFLPIYAPTRLAVVGDLRLVAEGDVGTVTVCRDPEAATEAIYDLSGRRVDPASRPAAGVYIEIAGGNSRKVLLK